MRWLVLLFGAAVFAQEYTGSRACVPCHAEQARRHAASMHERALRPAMGSRVPALFDRPVRERNGVELNYLHSAEGWIVEASLDGDKRRAALSWIFGAGTLAFTPVGTLDGQYFEHRVSWYSALGRPGMTMGHPSAKPASASAAIGQPQRPETIFRCFNCHATNVKPGPDLSAMQPGVQCERCHGPAASHVKGPKGSIIRKDATVEACAECHRMPNPAALNAAEPEKTDPVSIRFAPVGLMASKCFLASRNLTCVTCHDPHGHPATEMPPYEQKCRGCHAAVIPVRSHCPRQTNANCLGCHMKKAEVLPGLTFTDHRIRIYPRH